MLGLHIFTILWYSLKANFRNLTAQEEEEDEENFDMISFFTLLD